MEVVELKQRLKSSWQRKIRKADHPHLKKHYLEEQSASKLKMHKLSMNGTLLLSPKSRWRADRRTVTMNQAQLKRATAGPAIYRAHSPQNHLHPEHSESWTIKPPKRLHVQQETPKPRWYLSLPWSLGGRSSRHWFDLPQLTIKHYLHTLLLYREL